MNKKFIITTLVLSMVMGSAFAAKKYRNSTEKMGLRGNVNYMIVYTYNSNIVDKNGNRQLVSTDSITFDLRGNLEDKFTTAGNKFTYYSYYFDKNGYWLGWNEYDKNYNITARTAYLNDERGNCVERTVYGSKEKMVRKETSTYSKDNKLLEELRYTDDGTIEEKRIYKYDNRGNCTEIEFYDVNDSLMQTYMYKYDERDNETEWRFYAADGNLMAITTTYYDDHDNVTEMISFNYDEHLNWKHAYEYVYDENGNWTKQTIYRNNKPYQEIERKIVLD
jgi:hypothetical protein